MRRQDLLLAVLAASEGRPYTPVQLQKAVFLISKNLIDIVNDGGGYGFAPYDYGPFDVAVYQDAEALQGRGLASIAPAGSYRVYTATDRGVESGRAILDSMRPDYKLYIEEISRWVRSLSFNQLVKSIYEAYPEMKENSIFRG